MKIRFQKITSGKDKKYINLLKWNLERAKDFMEKTMYKEAVNELLNVKQKEEEALETLQSFSNIQSVDNQY